ncbi:MAG: hypothetical protein HY583_00125 [Candidatus Omnitrophica bacterium]|nr:hypothetical protein [Candidatus Omnitrophota bacterium]
MQRSLYKELWLMRFQKMLDLEREAVSGYSDLLKEYQDKYKGESQVQNHLKKLIIDEKKHAKLVEELLRTVQSQED